MLTITVPYCLSDGCSVDPLALPQESHEIDLALYRKSRFN